jgi:hypothetical protein
VKKVTEYKIFILVAEVAVCDKLFVVNNEIIKFALEQAMKVQRGRRGIAVLFL